MSTALEKAHAARKARAAAGEVLVRLNPIEKAQKKPKSLRLAVNAKCFDCVGQDCDPGWRKRISECAVTKCPLNPVRPYQKGGEDEHEDAEADSPTIVGVDREGLVLYALLSDERILRSPEFRTEEAAEDSLGNYPNTVADLLTEGWAEADNV